jgi:hypothetical protein
MAKRSALVFLDILELLLLVDQNVSLAQSAPKTKLATTKNVLILVLEHVASMPTVKSEITTPFVLVLLATLVILSSDVK